MLESLNLGHAIMTCIGRMNNILKYYFIDIFDIMIIPVIIIHQLLDFYIFLYRSALYPYKLSIQLCLIK